MNPMRPIKNGYLILTQKGLRETYKESKYFLRKGLIRALATLTNSRPHGTPIFEENWDVMIILDACRADVMAEVAKEYGFKSTDCQHETSVGSTSPDWMGGNFTDAYVDEMKKTTYVTGNPFSESYCTPAMFNELDEVWRYGWDDDLGTIPSRKLTDRAIYHARQTNSERLLLHYMKPHAPFTSHPELRSGPSKSSWGESIQKDVWMQVRDGELELETVIEAYYDELRVVLDEVQLLLQNIDADTVIITADHGESMGESGVYGHGRGLPIDVLHKVPWVETSGSDTGDYTPVCNTQHQNPSDDTESRLRDLGYR